MEDLRPLPSLRSPSPPPTFVPSGAQYTLVAMAMASQREVEGIGQKRPPHYSPLQPRTPFHLPPTQVQRVGCGRKRWGVREEGGRKDVKDREEVKDRERSEEGGRRIWGTPQRTGVPRPSG